MSSSTKRVLLVGLRSDAVDFEKWPELTVERLEQAFVDVVDSLTAAGFDTHWCLTDRGETAESQLQAELRDFEPDIVLIGAGVRADPDHLLLFERMINLIMRERPSVRVAFNTLPFDSVEAVQRWTD